MPLEKKYIDGGMHFHRIRIARDTQKPRLSVYRCADIMIKPLRSFQTIRAILFKDSNQRLFPRLNCICGVIANCILPEGIHCPACPKKKQGSTRRRPPTRRPTNHETCSANHARCFGSRLPRPAFVVLIYESTSLNDIIGKTVVEILAGWLPIGAKNRIFKKKSSLLRSRTRSMYPFVVIYTSTSSGYPAIRPNPKF